MAQGDDALDEERQAELRLAAACASGDERAAAELEARFLGEVRRAVERRTRSAALTDEVMQILRERLLVGGPGRAPEISDFRGAGPLAGWLRIAAVRIANRFMAKEERPVDAVDVLAGRLAARDDVELQMVRERYGPAVPECLRAAWDACQPDTRNLLRFRYVDGLTIDRIAALRRVHRATAARWLQQAEEQLVDDALARLAARFGAPPAEMRSVLRLIRSSLELAASRLFT